MLQKFPLYLAGYNALTCDSENASRLLTAEIVSPDCVQMAWHPLGVIDHSIQLVDYVPYFHVVGAFIQHWCKIELFKSVKEGLTH